MKPSMQWRNFKCFTGQAKASSQGPTCVDVTFISCHQNISEFFKGSGIRSTGFKSMGERWSALKQGTSLHQSGVNVISAIISCQPYINTCCFAAWNLAINNMWPSGATKKKIRSVSTYLSHSKSHSVFALMHHSPNTDVGIRSSFFPEVVHLSFLGFVWSFIRMQKVMKLWLPPKDYANFSDWVYPRKMAKWLCRHVFSVALLTTSCPVVWKLGGKKTRFQVHHDEIAQIPKTLVMVFLEDEIASFFGCCMLQMKGASSQKKVTVLEDRRTGFF